MSTSADSIQMNVAPNSLFVGTVLDNPVTRLLKTDDGVWMCRPAADDGSAWESTPVLTHRPASAEELAAIPAEARDRMAENADNKLLVADIAVWIDPSKWTPGDKTPSDDAVQAPIADELRSIISSSFFGDMPWPTIMASLNNVTAGELRERSAASVATLQSESQESNVSNEEDNDNPE